MANTIVFEKKKQAELYDDMKFLAEAVSTDFTRYSMQFIHAEEADGTMILVSTDGRRLHKITYPIAEAPIKEAGDYEIVSKKADIIVLKETDNHGTFPNWQSVVPVDTVCLYDEALSFSKKSFDEDYYKICQINRLVNSDYLRPLGNNKKFFMWSLDIDPREKGGALVFMTENRVAVIMPIYPTNDTKEFIERALQRLALALMAKDAPVDMEAEAAADEPVEDPVVTVEPVVEFVAVVEEAIKPAPVVADKPLCLPAPVEPVKPVKYWLDFCAGRYSLACGSERAFKPAASYSKEVLELSAEVYRKACFEFYEYNMNSYEVYLTTMMQKAYDANLDLDAFLSADVEPLDLGTLLPAETAPVVEPEPEVEVEPEVKAVADRPKSPPKKPARRKKAVTETVTAPAAVSEPEVQPRRTVCKYPAGYLDCGLRRFLALQAPPKDGASLAQYLVMEVHYECGQ